MNANAGHILIPISEQERRAGFFLEYDRAKRVWKRPHLEKPVETGAKVMKVINTPFESNKGKEHWNPFQVACFALEKAMDAGIDVIRVVTPGQENIPGEQAIDDVSFLVKDLVQNGTDDPAFFPDMKDGKITLEDEAGSAMPNRWKVHESGILAPVS